MAKEFKTGYKVTGDASGGVRAAQATRGELDKLNTSIEKQGKVSRETSAVFSKLTATIAAGAAIAVSALAFGFGKTVIETEKLRGSLVTMVGDVDRAGIAFDALTKFAERTPFTLDQSVQAFIKMKSLGLEPTESALESFGNTAAAMGKDMSQMIEAVADASTFEFERLKEFGIKARQQGDNVSLTFQGVTTTVKKNSAEIVGYLEGIGKTQFAGAMEDQMQRLPGIISNLEDNISGLFRAFGDVGGITLMGNAISWVSGLLGDLTETIRSGELIDEMSLRWEQFAGTMSDSWSKAIDAMRDSQNVFSTDFEGLFLSMGTTIDRFIEAQSNTGESFVDRWLDALALLPISFQELFGAIITIVGSSLVGMKNQLDIWLTQVQLGIADTANQLGDVFDRITFDKSGAAARAVAHQANIEALTQEIAQLEEHQRILAADSAAALTTAADNVLAAKQKMVANREAAAAQRELEAAAKKSSLTLDDLAKSAIAAGGEVAGLSTEAKAAAKAFQTLNDRLNPLAKLQREFTIEQALLVGKIAEGGEGIELYTQLLAKLKVEYAEDARAAVGFGAAAVAASEKAATAAEKAADRVAKAAQKEREKRATELAKAAADVETFRKAFERGIERMDDLGADLWKGFFTGAKSAMDSVKSFFQNWLGEMAHAAITRPILLNITGAIGIGGSSSVLAGGVGSIGGVGGLGGVGGIGGATGGGGGFGGITSLFTGNSIGSAFTSLGGSLPTWLGGTAGTGIAGPTAAGGNAAGGIFANASGVSNFQFGAIGLIAGILGDKIFGGQGGIGASLGATIGTAILPGIGTVVGGLLGGFLGGLIGGNKQPVLEVSGTSKANESGSDSDATFDSLLGGGFLRTRRIDAATVASIGKDLAAFDDSLAQFLSADEISEVTARLKTFERQMEGSAISIEELLEGRFNVILSVLSDDIRAFITEVSGLEEQAQRLAIATTAQKIIDAAPDLFEGRTFREFIAVAQAMQAEGEELSATFNRLANEVVSIVQQLELIKGFAGSDPSADFDAMIAQQGMSLFELANSLADQIRTLRAGFTGSADDLRQLAVLVSQRYETEIVFLAQIKQISDGIGSGFQSLRDTINRSLFGDEAFYTDLTTRAETLAANLKTLTDPAQISATVAEIQRLTGQAFGLLDEAGKAETGQGFLDFINGVESDAQASLTLARDLLLSESDVLRGLVADMAESFGDPLAIAATAHEDAAAALESAADSITEAATGLAGVGSGLVDAVRFGFALQNFINTGGPSVGTPGGVLVSSGGGSKGGVSTLEAANLTAQAIATAVLQAGAASAQAIKQSASTVQVQVVFPGRGMVNA